MAAKVTKLHSIESNRMRLDGGAMFGNAPKGMWERWIEPDSLNRIELATRCLLAQLDDGRNILFEVGIGAFFNEKLKERYGVISDEHMLLANLKRAGLKEGEIDLIILSHLHFDHAGGLLPEYEEGSLRLLFPNAKYCVGKRHWEYAKRPHPREEASFIPLLHELLESSGRLILVDGEPLPQLNFGISFTFSEGHTQGLMLSKLALPGGQLIFASDLIPGLSWVHLPIAMGYDRFAEKKVDEKAELFEGCREKRCCLFFTHDPKVECAELRKSEEGRYYG